jgi:hypothetical protein
MSLVVVMGVVIVVEEVNLVVVDNPEVVDIVMEVVETQTLLYPITFRGLVITVASQVMSHESVRAHVAYVVGPTTK